MTSLTCERGRITATNSKDAVIKAPSLGSSLAVCFWDRKNLVCAVGIAILPGAAKDDEVKSRFPMLYAHNGIGLLYKKWNELGGERSNLEVYLVGSAQFMEEPAELASGISIYKGVRKMLNKNKIPLAGEHVGGPVNRTLVADNKSGQIKVLWGQEREAIL